MDIDGSGEHIGVKLSPDVFQEDLPIDRDSPILSEVLEEIKLLGGEIYDFRVFRNQPFRRVYLQIADMNQSSFIGDISPSKCLDSRDEFLEIKGLPQIIIGSDIESGDDIFGSVSGS